MIDLRMPGLDGEGLAHRLRARTLSQPPALIAVTGFHLGAEADHTKNAGFSYLFQKPVFPDILAEAIRTCAPPRNKR